MSINLRVISAARKQPPFRSFELESLILDCHLKVLPTVHVVDLLGSMHAQGLLQRRALSIDGMIVSVQCLKARTLSNRPPQSDIYASDDLAVESASTEALKSGFDHETHSRMRPCRLQDEFDR